MLELAWDGDWYRRAYFDDGTPLGSAQNEECRIDSLTQSWAVLSQAAEPRRAARAMEAVRAHLVRRDAQLVLLLTPPFDRMAHDPGYIKGYLPGIRENGGQYTHAALWAVIALARLGLGDEAMELFHMINPINHTRTPEGVERYRAEPYAVAADVYAHPMHLGRGGWTWYTGFGRVDVSGGDRGRFSACAGATASSASIRRSPRCGRDTRSTGTSAGRATASPSSIRTTGAAACDRRKSTASRPSPQAIPLLDDGKTHEVVIVLGKASTPVAHGWPSVRPSATTGKGLGDHSLPRPNRLQIADFRLQIDCRLESDAISGRNLRDDDRWHRRCKRLVAMNEKAEALKKRTKEFTLAVLGFVRTLPSTDDAKIIGRQLIRSATGVGANYRATCRSRSKAEFVARVGVALEEADESAFWLEIITEARIATGKQAFELLDEARSAQRHPRGIESHRERIPPPFTSRQQTPQSANEICNLQSAICNFTMQY